MYKNYDTNHIIVCYSFVRTEGLYACMYVCMYVCMYSITSHGGSILAFKHLSCYFCQFFGLVTVTVTVAYPAVLGVRISYGICIDLQVRMST
jgi:hypothetical protein